MWACLFWYNSGGPHNSVSEKPRGLMDDRDIRREEFQLLKKWGAKGVKVDFFQSDKQNIIQLYQEILKDAAEAKIMVNFHGCTLPRGWSRTYPHLMSMEGVRGEECYSFDEKFTTEAPIHNVILPFTRNAVGSMDYTPVMFADNVYKHLTTYCHELALPIIFESGWLHFADGVKQYLDLPEAPKEFLKHVPTVWDETRFLGGRAGPIHRAGPPQRHAVVPRRHQRRAGRPRRGRVPVFPRPKPRHDDGDRGRQDAAHLRQRNPSRDGPRSSGAPPAALRRLRRRIQSDPVKARYGAAQREEWRRM